MLTFFPHASLQNNEYIIRIFRDINSLNFHEITYVYIYTKPIISLSSGIHLAFGE